MITINLLSPEQKQELKIKRIYLAINEIVVLVLLFSSIVAILLVGSRYFLEQQLTELIIKNAASLELNQKISLEIEGANKKISGAFEIQKNFRKWSTIIPSLAKLASDKIVFNFVKIYRQEATIEMEGTAQTRDDLLAFKAQLENSTLFEQISLPTADLLSKEKNIFHIKAKIKTDQIPQ